jgi:hypothetical protein
MTEEISKYISANPFKAILIISALLVGLGVFLWQKGFKSIALVFMIVGGFNIVQFIYFMLRGAYKKLTDEQEPVPSK